MVNLVELVKYASTFASLNFVGVVVRLFLFNDDLIAFICRFLDHKVLEFALIMRTSYLAPHRCLIF